MPINQSPSGYSLPPNNDDIELTQASETVRALLSDMGLESFPDFRPVLYSHAGDLYFLVSDVSYSQSGNSVSLDFGTELKLAEQFPDPIRKAQGKPIQLQENLEPKGFFCLRANQAKGDIQVGAIVGFLIQGINLVSDELFFSEETGRYILSQLVTEYCHLEEKQIVPEYVHYFLRNIIHE